MRFVQRIREIRIFRTMRFRLASTFLVLLICVTVALGVIGMALLRSILDTRAEQALEEELTAFRGYLHFWESNGEPYWFVDTTDPEEAAAVERLQKVYVVARPDGSIWQGTANHAFDAMTAPAVIARESRQIEATKSPLFKTIVGDDGGPYLIISTLLVDTAHQKSWYVAIGRSLADNQQLVRRFRRNYFFIFGAAIVVCILASWFSSGRALAALQSVEHAARGITGTNLGLQIPLRGAGDELDRLIESFNSMSGRLKASFDQIRQFSTDVSHELRTPLTAIQGQLEVALFTAKQPEQLREAIENALQDVERLSNLVRALLLLSHSETGQLRMNKTPVDLSEMVADLVEQFQIPAEAQDVRLTVKAGARVICEVDRTQMERVITNLLSNALKYTPPGGRIQAWVEPAGDHARIVVEDSGVGIPQDHLPHIFDRFYRVPDPNPEKGLGLGLSFVASIVKAHGGEVHVRSTVGKGSRFSVVLPSRSLSETAVAPPVHAESRS